MANKHRLLVIEDDYDVAEMLLMYFQSHGYEVIHADTGLVGVEMARSKFPNLILLDVMLPEMDGYDVCRELRKQSLTRYIPAIFLTQRDERASKVKGLELGADDYITKPFDVDELRLRVQGAIRRATRESLHEVRTGLPTGPLIEEELTRRYHDDQPYLELHYAVQSFQAYADLYGFIAADDVIGFIGRTIQQAVSQHGTQNDFVGIKDNEFIVLTHTTDPLRLDEAIKRAFEEGVRPFYSFLDSERGEMVLNEGAENELHVPLMALQSFRAERQEG